jgi:phosphoglycolate phosphatase-like HAD superfamily hydrolase
MPAALQDDFSKKWMNEIESHEFLEWDAPFENIHCSLELLNESWRLVLVTGRQHEDRCVSQLRRFGWNHFFDRILVTKQVISKQDLIRSLCPVHEGDMIVGDGPEEILAGRDLGIDAVSVLSGATSFERMVKYSPDEIFENFENFANSKG